MGKHHTWYTLYFTSLHCFLCFSEPAQHRAWSLLEKTSWADTAIIYITVTYLQAAMVPGDSSKQSWNIFGSGSDCSTSHPCHSLPRPRNPLQFNFFCPEGFISTTRSEEKTTGTELLKDIFPEAPISFISKLRIIFKPTETFCSNISSELETSKKGDWVGTSFPSSRQNCFRLGWLQSQLLQQIIWNLLLK